MNKQKRKGTAGHEVNFLIHVLANRAVLLSVTAEHILGQSLVQKFHIGGLSLSNRKEKIK